MFNENLGVIRVFRPQIDRKHKEAEVNSNFQMTKTQTLQPPRFSFLSSLGFWICLLFGFWDLEF